MDVRDLLIPALLFAGSLPMFAIAWRVGHGDLHWLNGLAPTRLRDPAALGRRLGWLLAAVGIALWLVALGLYWAGGDPGRLALVSIALLVAVNGWAVALFVAARRAGREQLPPPGRPGDGRGSPRP